MTSIDQFYLLILTLQHYKTLPPKFNSVLEMSVAVRNAPVLCEEIAVLLAKDAIEPVPPAERRQGFYTPYFIVPKKGGGLRPILDLRVLNRALHKFKMRTRMRIIKCIQPQDWFAAIDLFLSPRVFTKVVEGDLPRYGKWASGSSTTSTIGLS